MIAKRHQKIIICFSLLKFYFILYEIGSLLLNFHFHFMGNFPLPLTFSPFLLKIFPLSFPF